MQSIKSTVDSHLDKIFLETFTVLFNYKLLFWYNVYYKKERLFKKLISLEAAVVIYRGS